MRKLFVMLFAIGCFTAPAFAQKITIDYAKEFDFGKVKTFTYNPTDDTNSKDPLMDGRIKDAIISQLKEGGLTQVDIGPDLYVTYHIATKDNTVYDTTTMGYGGYGMGWGGWGGGMATSTTTAMTYTEGTLIIDAYDSTDKKMVWRGTGTVTLKQNPEKVTKQIHKIVTKMGEKWAKILKKQGE
jgi:hypothetical protein